jgi:hypothetical protein
LRLTIGVGIRDVAKARAGRRGKLGTTYKEALMDALAEKLDERLRQWRPDTAAEARERIAEVMELADQDLLDVARSRAAEQEVIDLLDEPPAR